MIGVLVIGQPVLFFVLASVLLLVWMALGFWS